MTGEACRSYDGEYKCQRARGHEGWHRSETGAPKPFTREDPHEGDGVALVSSAPGAAPAASIVSWI